MQGLASLYEPAFRLPCAIHSQFYTHTHTLIADSTQRVYSQRMRGSSRPSERERDPATAQNTDFATTSTSRLKPGYSKK